MNKQENIVNYHFFILLHELIDDREITCIKTRESIKLIK